ncbi:MAG: hypothetical protein M3457_22275 [Chloroflexota bacterium]|nr:hypothetical protein [Chloroflexota bacterium]
MGSRRLSRSVLLTMSLVLVLVVGLAGGLAQQGGLSSGALGLTRAEIDEQWGQGVGPFAGPGFYFNVYEMYTYYSQRGNYHVAYQDVNGRDIAVYLEVDLPGGMSEREARVMTAGYLPVDAQLTDVYTAPPTPDGAIALTTYRYVSASLDAAYGGILPGEILVIVQERWGDPDFEFGTRVIGVSMMVRTITQ